MRVLLTALVLLAAVPAIGAEIAWKKTIVDRNFRSEGVAVADVNKDGKMDILTGDWWFEAPDWKAHAIRPGKADYREGDKNVYCKSFACWADDINADGWADLVVVGFPGAPCHWYENPKNQPGMWQEHLIGKSACNETPTYVDLFGKGKKALVMGYQEKELVWAAPGQDPTQPWTHHVISEPGKAVQGGKRFDHGLGVSDVNGDGRLDVIVTSGWYEQPEKDADKPWKFHAAALGAACADMYAYDLDGDKRNDILSSSAHNYGIWSYLQKSDGSFIKKDLFPKIFSQSHALVLADINGDGQKDFVTGKRYWAHGPTGDADPMAPAVLYWFEARRAADGIVTFTPHEIDNDSGIGTQFWVGDFNGDKLPDIVISNKKGTFLFEQVRK